MAAGIGEKLELAGAGLVANIQGTFAGSTTGQFSQKIATQASYKYVLIVSVEFAGVSQPSACPWVISSAEGGGTSGFAREEQRNVTVITQRPIQLEINVGQAGAIAYNIEYRLLSEEDYQCWVRGSI